MFPSPKGRYKERKSKEEESLCVYVCMCVFHEGVN